MEGVHYLTKSDPPPMKHQTDFFYFAWDKEYVAALCDIGTGKSRLLIDVGANRFAQGQIDAMFVIAPSGVAQQWVTEQLPVHCPIDFHAYLYHAGNTKKKLIEFDEFTKTKDSRFKVLVTNTEIFSRDTYIADFRRFLLANRTFLVIDEVHLIKQLDAQRTHNVMYGLSDLTKHGSRIVGVRPLSTYRAIATGSMVSNNPVDLYAPMNFLKPGYFGMSLPAFKAKYCLERSDHVPGSHQQFRRKLSLAEMRSMRAAASRAVPYSRIANIFSVSENDVEYIVEHPELEVPYKNLDTLKLAIRPVSFIIKAADCIDLPPNVYEKRFVDMGDEQRRVYKELVKNLEVELRGKELSVTNSLSLLIRLSQVTSNFYPVEEGKVERIEQVSPKIKALITEMEDNMTFPCIVFSRFVAEVKEATDAIKANFPDRVVEYIVGEVADKEREDIKTRFKAGEVDVLVATPGTTAVGLNLQAASVEYYLSNDYSYTTRNQAEGRISRQGQKASHCIFVDFLCENTIDMKVYDVLRLKKDLVEYMRSRSVGEFLGGR